MKIIYSAMAVLMASANLFGGGFALTSVSPRTFAPQEYEAQYSSVKFVIDNPNFSEVNATITDLSGREVRSGLSRKDETTLVWDGRDSNGRLLPAGVYIYQLQADERVISGSVVLVQ